MLHIVMYTWKDHVTVDDIADLTVALRALPEQIDELERYEVGPDLNLNDDTADFGIVAQVADERALGAYRDHPAHQSVVATLRKMAAQRTAVQINP